MALMIAISTGDFQIHWNVLSLSFSERESGKWPLGLSDFYRNYLISKAAITRCNLSSRFFCIDATLLCEIETNNI